MWNMLVKRVGVKSQGWVPGSAGFFDMTWEYIARNGNSKVLEQKLGMGLPVILSLKTSRIALLYGKNIKPKICFVLFLLSKVVGHLLKE